MQMMRFEKNDYFVVTVPMSVCKAGEALGRAFLERRTLTSHSSFLSLRQTVAVTTRQIATTYPCDLDDRVPTWIYPVFLANYRVILVALSANKKV